MTSPESKVCRHCSSLMETAARVCPHCRSHQGWFASTRDPRFFLVSVLGLLSISCVFLFFIHYLTDQDRKRLNPLVESPCRGLVIATTSNHTVEKKDNIDRLFVRVFVENKFKRDVSDPVIRVDVLGRDGEVLDTFVRTIYGANLPGTSSAWFRVADDLAMDPSKTIVSVKASVQRADCRSAWR